MSKKIFSLLLLCLFFCPVESWASKKKRTKTVSAEEYLWSKDVATPRSPQEQGFCILVDTKNQRVWAYQDGRPVFESVTTTGKPSSPTPKGKFHVIKKHKKWTSTIYHVPMNYFLRLNPHVFGLHAGQIRTSPASHGCIRLPEYKAQELFDLCPVGTFVYII
jgi:lipoprotein-anchoring transpeptidase ErfK/SrfK